MAKPAKTKKDQAEEAAKSGKKPVAKAVAKGKGNGAAAKGKAAKQPAAKGGLKSRLSKTPPAKGKAATGKDKRSATKFLREVKLEMSKVTWPSRDELIQSTIVVLVAVAIAGVYIFIFDEIFSRFIQYLTTLTG